MSHTSPGPVDSPGLAVSPLAWERQLRPALAAISDRPPRAVLVGAAGSGKSAGMHQLHRLFRRQAREVRLLHDARVDLRDVPPEVVLLVDDLHRLPDPQLEVLSERLDEADAALVVASRPWPARPALRDITRRLEQDVPAIVLGHATRSDVLDHLIALGMTLPDSCVDHILSDSSGMSWLVTVAVQQHDRRDCVHDGAHTELDRALAELIIHRLDLVDERLRSRVEEVCAASQGGPRAPSDPTEDDWIMQGYAEGLLLRNGDAPALVRAAVRRGMSARRLIDLYSRFPNAVEYGDDQPPVHDPAIAAALVSSADRIRRTEPAHACDLYDAAVECGAAAESLVIRRAQSSWSAGDIDRASSLVDAALGSAAGPDPVAPELADMLAATWAARAMMTQASKVYRLAPPSDAGARTNADLAAIAVGRAEEPEPIRVGAAGALPSVLGVSLDLLRTGLRATLAPDSTESVLPDLVRASEMYTSSHDSGPLCELPAVIAGIVALNLGRLVTAQAVIDGAMARGHGGPWARSRLLLWSAWIAVQRAHPVEATDTLRRALVSAPGALPTRDALLMHAVRVAIARRYDDASGLEAAWDEARASLLRSDIDLYLLHPLTELVIAATKVGDAARVEPHFSRGMQILEQLGDPPIWATHLRWAGIQRGILLSSPERLAPHAQALVAHSAHSRVAASMARAGRVWTDVLAGSVDGRAVVTAAEDLAGIGLMWDAARLAGHGAARTDDRRIAAQLLACARELHPNDGTHRIVADDDSTGNTAQTPVDEVLSEREIEVARLVLQGKTYAEIGETVFISPRTVEHHIAHIRQRLGATSRSEVLARLRQLLGDGGRGTGRADAPPSSPHSTAGIPPMPSVDAREYDPNQRIGGGFR